jgi:hypothetical protein
MVKDETRAREIVEKIVRGFKYHGRCITIDDVQELGLNAEEPPQEIWNLVWEFHGRWEEIGTTPAREGSPILGLDIGRGVAFIPAEVAGGKQ